MRREKSNRAVAPVIRQRWSRILFIELLNRQQLDCGDTEALQVWNLFDQSRIGAAPMRLQAGTRMACEAADVQLIDRGPTIEIARRDIVLPVVGIGIDDDALHGLSTVVAGM